MAGLFDNVHRDESGKWVMNNAAPDTSASSAQPTGLASRGNGDFVSVDDYNRKTGTDIMNQISKLQTYDSQMYKDAMNSGNFLASEQGGGTGYIKDNDTGFYKAGNASDYLSGSVVANRGQDENYQKLVAGVQNLGPALGEQSAVQQWSDQRDWNKKSDEEKAYLTAKNDYDNYYNMYSKRYDALMQNNPQFTEQGRQAYIETQMASDPVSLFAMQQLPEMEKKWKEYQTSNPEQGDVNSAAEQAAMQAIKYNTQQTANPAGSLDTMDYDNSYNQSLTYDYGKGYTDWRTKRDAEIVAKQEGYKKGTKEYEDFVNEYIRYITEEGY